MKFKNNFFFRPESAKDDQSLVARIDPLAKEHSCDARAALTTRRGQPALAPQVKLSFFSPLSSPVSSDNPRCR